MRGLLAVVLYSHDLGMAMLIGTSSDNTYLCGILGVDCQSVCGDSGFPELISIREL